MVKTVLTMLAGWRGPWHGHWMRTSGNPVAGGFIIAITTTVGALWGAREGQPSAGLLAGLGVGIAMSLLIWLLDRR